MANIKFKRGATVSSVTQPALEDGSLLFATESGKIYLDDSSSRTEFYSDRISEDEANGKYIQMTNGATTTLASSLQVSGINNIEFTEEGEDPITASSVSYSNTTSGMTSGNVQNAIDELFQSVSEGKSLIAAAVTDKGVETAATDSFATMAGNIGQISSGGSGGGVETVVGTISAGKYGLSVGYSDGNSYISGSWSGTDIGSGSITVLKNSIIVTFSDSGIQISGGISRGDDIYGNTYFVSGDFSLTGY